MTPLHVLTCGLGMGMGLIMSCIISSIIGVPWAQVHNLQFLMTVMQLINQQYSTSIKHQL